MEFTTDENGKLTLNGISGPDVIGTEQALTVYKDGYEPYEGTVDYTETLDALKLVILTEAKATLNVIVNDTDYEPIANATVVFQDQEYKTDETGKVTITDIAATTVIGTYAEVTVSAAGYYPETREADFTETLDAYLLVNLKRNSGIEAITVETEAAADKVYDLQGRRVMQPVNGTVVIMNGNKIHLNK